MFAATTGQLCDLPVSPEKLCEPLSLSAVLSADQSIVLYFFSVGFGIFRSVQVQTCNSATCMPDVCNKANQALTQHQEPTPMHHRSAANEHLSGDTITMSQC